jgi:hypothetical protein
VLWLHTFRSFTTPRSLFDCLVDRFGKPLRRFNALAPLDARLSGSQRNAIVSRTRGLLRARLVAAAALRERLSRRQRAVCRLAQLLVAAPTFADSLASGTACRQTRRRCRFTASDRRTRRRPR